MNSWSDRRKKYFKSEERNVTITTDTLPPKLIKVDVCVGDIVIKYQSIGISKEEVNTINEYISGEGKQVVWIIDCTTNIKSPCFVSDRYAESSVWVLEFDKEWHSKSMVDCPVVFADFGESLFRIPVRSIVHRMVTVFSKSNSTGDFVGNLSHDEFVEYIHNPSTIKPLIPLMDIPQQAMLTVAQDPHGSGKTYNLTRMMIHTEDDKYKKYKHYRTFIVVTKPHSAKDVVYAEFKKHLMSSGCSDITYNTINKKYTVTFTRPSGDSILVIFGTVDSLMWNLADNNVKSTDTFIGLVKTIHHHGPTKLKGPRGGFHYASEFPQLNSKTLLITDEATMLPESYCDAFVTLMNMCHVDVHLAGDVQQSTIYEHNLLTKVLGEYNCYHSSELPSFPGILVTVDPGNEVRRFNSNLVENFRNVVMRDFHRTPSHDLNIMTPVASPEVTHSMGEFSIHGLHVYNPMAPDCEIVTDNMNKIYDQITNDVQRYNLVPNDILVVTPFVHNNPLMDELQTKLHEFWASKIEDPEYFRFLKDTPYWRGLSKIRNSSALIWYCVLHRSEDGKPIDTSQSEFSTRIVSIHASQGDGRRFVYVVGLGELALKKFTAGKINIKYESLVNVAISRMKEVVRIYIYPIYDDIWKRFKPLIGDTIKIDSLPDLYMKNVIPLENCTLTDDEQGLYDSVRDCIVEETQSGKEKESNPLVDYDHHVVRILTANSVFHAKLLQHQCQVGTPTSNRCIEQLYTLFKTVSEYTIKPCKSKDYYKTLRLLSNFNKMERPREIPILYYDTGDSSYSSVFNEIVATLLQVQKHIRSWISPNCKGIDKTDITPQKAVVLQYCLSVIKHGIRCKVKIDTVYDVFKCYMHESDLTYHYEYLFFVVKLYEKLIHHLGHKNWTWKIHRVVKLGQTTGEELPGFTLKHEISHIYVSDTHAIPVLLVADMEDVSMARRCSEAILNTLVCMCPLRELGEGGYKSTYDYVNGKKIKICFVPIKDTDPIFVDVSHVIEMNYKVIVEWLCGYIHKIAEHNIETVTNMASDCFSEIEDLQIEFSKTTNKSKYPDYICRGVQNAETLPDLDRECRKCLKKQIKLLQHSMKKV